MLAREAIEKAHAAVVQGKLDEAEQAYLTILDQTPNYDQALFGLGNVWITRQRPGVAMAFYKQAYDANSGNLSAALNLAAALGRLRLRDEAEKIYNPLSVMLEQRGQLPDAIRFRMLGDIYGNWSGLYVNNGTPARAIELARNGLKHNADQLDCHNHLALGLLEIGEWNKAVPHWDRRLERQTFHQRHYGPVWNGEEVETLVIHGEQGVGDEVMFMSAFESAKAKRVVIECNHRLTDIFARSFGVECLQEDEILKKYPNVHQIAMGSLFFRHKPDGRPYLKANPEYAAEYASRLRSGKLNIGIAWKGGTDRTHKEVRRVGLENWAPILSQPHNFISLQYGDEASEADRYGLVHWNHAIADLERQIALISELDLIITTCQSVVHFAGALGKPVWCLTPDKPRWCYGMKGEMPMYASVTQYRKTSDWNDVITRIASDLGDLGVRNAA